jgi:hypothetical protein
MRGYENVQIINNKAPLILKQRRTDVFNANDGKSLCLTTELKIDKYGGQLQIQIAIKTEYPKRTTYTYSVFHCGPDIADMIAEACTKRAVVAAA